MNVTVSRFFQRTPPLEKKESRDDDGNDERRRRRRVWRKCRIISQVDVVLQLDEPFPIYHRYHRAFAPRFAPLGPHTESMIAPHASARAATAFG